MCTELEGATRTSGWEEFTPRYYVAMLPSCLFTALLLHFFYIPLPFFSFLESEAATKQYSCYYPGSSVFLKNTEDDGGQHILCEYFYHHPCLQRRVRAASVPVFFYWQCDQKKLHANKSTESIPTVYENSNDGYPNVCLNTGSDTYSNKIVISTLTMTSIV